MISTVNDDSVKIGDEEEDGDTVKNEEGERKERKRRSIFLRNDAKLGLKIIYV